MKQNITKPTFFCGGNGMHDNHLSAAKGSRRARARWAIGTQKGSGMAPGAFMNPKTAVFGNKNDAALKNYTHRV